MVLTMSARQVGRAARWSDQQSPTSPSRWLAGMGLMPTNSEITTGEMPVRAELHGPAHVRLVVCFD